MKIRNSFSQLGIAAASMGLIFAGESQASFAPLPEEQAMAQLIVQHSDQQRPAMERNELLNFVARKKAEDMARRAYFSHVDPDGYALNRMLALAGYEHPYSQNRTVNNVESIGARHQNRISGSAAASMVFEAWLKSAGHHLHVLGKFKQFADQTRFGVGYAFAPAGPHGYSSHYFVFLSAPPDDQAAVTPYLEWQFSKMTLPQMDHPEADPDEDGVPNRMEYIVNSDPLAPNSRPPYEFGYDAKSGQVTLDFPVRADLDPSIQVRVETSTSLAAEDWTTEGVARVRDLFTAGARGENYRFLRIQISRALD